MPYVLIKVACLCLLLVVLLPAKQYAQVPDSADYSLLVNPFIQIEATEAINSMYNFKFEKSRRHFIYLKKQYPWHPLPYLLIGMNYWWRIVPNYENEEWDKQFIAYMDTTEVLAKRLRDRNQIEGAFFLATAKALEGRLHAERRKYRKAAFAGKSALKYLSECRGHETYSPELLFGDALFNYYAQWIREEYPLLRPLMMLFPKGDKEKGIEQLKEVARNAFYSRTEAQYYLMRLLSLEENDLEGGLQVAKYLHVTYPNNSYFQRFYARLLYRTGKYAKAEHISLGILSKTDSLQEGYGANTARYAAFFLGHIYELRKNYTDARKYYSEGLGFAKEANATDKGYYFYSLLNLGRIAQKEGKKKQAKDYYKQVKKVARRSHSAHQSARKRLKSLDGSP